MKSNVKNIICHCTTSTQVNAVKRHKENCIIYVYCRKIYNLFVRVSETGIKRAIRLTDSDCSLAIFKRRCLIRSRNFLPIASTWVHPRFFFKIFGGVGVAHLFFYVILLACLYVLSSVLWCPLRFPHKKRCSVRHYLHLFVWGRMSSLRYLCLFVYGGVQHILCCVFGFVCLRFMYCT
jgi:hypothetical protein